MSASREKKARQELNESGYVDPRKAREAEEHAEGEAGTLGRDPSGKGYITLNFFNLFWIFVVASVLGLLMEEIVHFLFVVPGQWQDRAGLLFGPFSPIYGCGAVLMTIFLNRFHKSNWLVIFLVAAVIGGAFEAFVSLFMQYAFGAVAWDYSNMPGSLFGGRTCLPFMACWGLLGVVWIKLLLPFMLRLVNFIPWNWRYMLTTVAACFMLVDAVMTLQALDCWYMRLSHDPVDTPLQQFYDHEFGMPGSMMMTIDQPPFYATKEFADGLCTTGGLIVDTECRVLDKDRQPIEGLFAAGIVSGGMFYNTYPHHLNCLSHTRNCLMGYTIGQVLGAKQ